MKTLYLLRHGAAAQRRPGEEDRDRSLSDSGREEMIRLGAELSDLKVAPALAFCSSARRARETLDAVQHSPGSEAPAEVIDDLYLAPPDLLLRYVIEAPNGAGSLLIIAHNPGLHALALGLSGRASDPDALARLARQFPSGAFAELTFEIDTWDEVGRARGALNRLLLPGDL